MSKSNHTIVYKGDLVVRSGQSYTANTPEIKLNRAIAEMNKNVSARATASNTLTFSGQIRFLGPNGGANYGLPSWKSLLEDVIMKAISEFMRRSAGQTTPEGIMVEPIGFSVTHKVNQQSVIPSVLTVAR